MDQLTKSEQLLAVAPDIFNREGIKTRSYMTELKEDPLEVLAHEAIMMMANSDEPGKVLRDYFKKAYNLALKDVEHAIVVER